MGGGREFKTHVYCTERIIEFNLQYFRRNPFGIINNIVVHGITRIVRWNSLLRVAIFFITEFVILIFSKQFVLSART